MESRRHGESRGHGEPRARRARGTESRGQGEPRARGAEGRLGQGKVGPGKESRGSAWAGRRGHLEPIVLRAGGWPVPSSAPGLHPLEAGSSQHPLPGVMTKDAFKCKAKMSAAQSCPSLWDPIDCSLPGSSVRGVLQATMLEWVAISFSRGTSPPRDRTWVSDVSCLGRRDLCHPRHGGSPKMP